MQRRALLSLVNLAVAAGALLVFFLYPRYAGYALYVFLGWFVVSLATTWATRGSAPAVGPRAVAAAAPASPTTPPPRTGAPLAGAAAGGASTIPSGVGFCIYCAADLPADTDRCPACGHAGARLT